MKNFVGSSFFRAFDLVVGRSNPALKRAHWSCDGVNFERERHSFAGSKHALAIEIFTLTRPGRRGWSLMVVKEYWWVGDDSTALKNLRWARPIHGRRGDILAWLRSEENGTGAAFLAAGENGKADAAGGDEVDAFEEL